MPLKQDVLNSITTKNYNYSEVRQLVNSVSTSGGLEATPPTHLKKGDVLVLRVGEKSRPCVIVKVYKDMVAYIPLTSSENVQCMSPSKSRFFNEGHFCKTFNVCSIEIALSSFVGVYDNPKLVNLAIKEFKKFIAESL